MPLPPNNNASAAPTERRPRKIPANGGVFSRGRGSVQASPEFNLDIWRSAGRHTTRTKTSTKVTLAKWSWVDKGPVFVSGEMLLNIQSKMEQRAWSEFFVSSLSRFWIRLISSKLR